MISFDIQGHTFHLRAAAVVIEDGWALLHRLKGDAIWALPGGRVDAGEQAASAVVREMMEEADEQVECGELLYVIENFFEHNDSPQHEIGLYFRTVLPPGSRLRDKTRSHAGTEGAKALEFRWFQLAELAQVNLHPALLRAALAAAAAPARHLVQGPA